MRTTLLFVVLAFAGCKDATKDFENLADRACACKDAACADKVVDDLITFVENNKGARGDKDRAEAAGRKLGECVIKAGVDPEKFMAKMKRVQDLDE